MNKKSLLLLLVPVFLAIVAWQFAVLPTGQVSEIIAPVAPQTKTVNVVANFGGSETPRRAAVSLVANETVFTATKRLADIAGIAFGSKTYPGLGRMIVTLGDKTNGVGGKYWQYDVNGAYATVGADSYIPRNGDIIEWKFKKSSE